MGSRYGGLKQMDGLGPHGETIIDYSIHDAVEAGFGKVVYIVRESFKDQMEAAVKEKYAGVKTVDGEPLQFVFVTQELNKIPAGFTVPGGQGATPFLHLARTQARTVERRLWTLHRTYPVDPAVMRMVNRLSDYLYALTL
jgi:hypothetical protein